ncbi:MAG: hypothetical protein ACRC2R_17890 [Xenococcaceae cyanobacterium]
MKKPNNITISLPQRLLEKLEALTQDNETIGQCAKRLIVSLLEGSQTLEVPDDLQQSLSEIFTRLEKLEGKEGVENRDRLEARINQLETRLEAIALTDTDLLERLEARFKSIEHWLEGLTDKVGKRTEERSEPQLSAAPQDDRDPPSASEMFLVCEVNSSKAIIWYWGEKDWTKDRNEAKIYSSEASAKKAVNNLKKKVPDSDIRWNSLERILAIESR